MANSQESIKLVGPCAALRTKAAACAILNVSKDTGDTAERRDCPVQGCAVFEEDLAQSYNVLQQTASQLGCLATKALPQPC